MIKKFYEKFMRFEHKIAVSPNESFNHIRGIK